MTIQTIASQYQAWRNSKTSWPATKNYPRIRSPDGNVQQAMVDGQNIQTYRTEFDDTKIVATDHTLSNGQTRSALYTTNPNGTLTKIATEDENGNFNDLTSFEDILANKPVNQIDPLWGPEDLANSQVDQEIRQNVNAEGDVNIRNVEGSFANALNVENLDEDEADVDDLLEAV